MAEDSSYSDEGSSGSSSTTGDAATAGEEDADQGAPEEPPEAMDIPNAVVAAPTNIRAAGRGNMSGDGGRGNVHQGRGRGAAQGGGRGGHGHGRGRGRGRGEGGRPMGRSNYSQMEVFNMLESVREYLPISGLEWELAAQRHMAYHPDEERSGDQLKKNSTSLPRSRWELAIPLCHLMFANRKKFVA